MDQPESTAQQAALRMQDIFAAQQRAYAQNPYPDAASRRATLRTLKTQLLRYQDVLVEAIDRDFGGRSTNESRMLDILPTTLEINHAVRHLGRWMKKSRRPTELLFLTNSLSVTYQPKGVVGVIATWNFPIYLSLGPMVTALAAGNRVMLKMPENMPATTATLRQLLGDVFPEDQIAVIGEELTNPGLFTALPFNHIVFTGSPGVGRIVMRQAAENLTPVTLELGGKSPAVVLPDYPIADAAKRIAHGKATNCGQICVAPDYALVPRPEMDAFVAAVKDGYAGFFRGEPNADPDYTAIVSDRHATRLARLLEDARAKGAHVFSCGDASDARKMPLQIVTGCTADMAVMQEEIFGPILPVVPYDTVDDAIRYIEERPRPLALYCFTRDGTSRTHLLQRTHSGGVTVNDWGWHVVNHAAPFGGIGNSGMGNYHGAEGFRELSHARTVFERHRWFPIGLFYPPYGNLAQRLTLKFFTGQADPTVKKRF